MRAVDPAGARASGAAARAADAMARAAGAIAAVELASVELVRRTSRHLLVRARDRAGRTGWGECSPLPGRSPDTVDRCAAVLGSGSLADLPPDLPAARFALETALLDLAAQAAGGSVAALLADDPLAALAASAVVAPGDPPPPHPHPPGDPVTTWKVKIGRGDPDRELDALRRLRPQVRHLRIDVNRAWSRAEAARRLPPLAALEPEWVEEALSAEDLLAAGGAPLPVALDESALDQPEATREALERGLVAALVLKPALLGGHLACLAWAARAREAGAVPVVSHLFDGPIALAACAELALAIGRPGDPAAGLGRHAGLAALPDIAVPQLSGAELVSHRPGLGARP